MILITDPLVASDGVLIQFVPVYFYRGFFSAYLCRDPVFGSVQIRINIQKREAQKAWLTGLSH